MSNQVQYERRSTPERRIDQRRRSQRGPRTPPSLPERELDTKALFSDRLWTVREAAVFLARSTSWVYKAAERGERASAVRRIFWWALQDSNLRPLPCERPKGGWQGVFAAGKYWQSRWTYVHTQLDGSAGFGSISRASCCILAAGSGTSPHGARDCQAPCRKHPYRLPPLRARASCLRSRRQCDSNRTVGSLRFRHRRITRVSHRPCLEWPLAAATARCGSSLIESHIAASGEPRRRDRARALPASAASPVSA